jgi:hypothetical protein
MPDYYYLAREMELLNKDVLTIASLYLSAVWQNYADDKRVFLINKTISYIDKIPKSYEYHDEYQLTKLDLLRRGGFFNDASILIESMKADSVFYTDFIADIIGYQIDLIAQQDMAEHLIPVAR